MTTLTEGMHEGEFIGELAMGIGYHVDEITLKSGNDLSAGTVLGAVELGTPTVTPGTPVSGTGGTVGNGTVGTWTADAGAMEGKWEIEITAAATNAGKFEVRRPDGTVDGVGTVAVAYNGGINGTLADGSTDWSVGDIIPVDVTYDGDDRVTKYVAHDPSATDGSQVAAAILVPNCDASAADQTTRALLRGPAVVNGNDLTWHSGITDAEKALAESQLLALGIRVA